MTDCDSVTRITTIITNSPDWIWWTQQSLSLILIVMLVVLVTLRLRSPR